MKLSLLVVEDDPDHLAILEHYLGKCGERVGEVEVCETAADAAARLQAGGIDLVFLDLTLPDSGIDETVALIPEFARLGADVVVTSSLDVPDLIESARRGGALEFLSKQEISVASLRDVLDRVAKGEDPGGSNDAGLVAEPAPAPIADDSVVGAIAAREIASKLAHDVNSLVTTVSFRAAALERHEQLESCDVAAEHLGAIKDAARSISAFVRGARAVVMDETRELALHRVDLAAWVDAELAHVIELIRKVDADLDIAPGLPVVVADDEALAHVFTILATNANRPGERAVLRVTPGDVDGSVMVADDGGPWADFDPKEFGQAVPRGRADRATAGLGHFRLVRLMQRMGGDADLVARTDQHGAYAVRLRFRLA